MFCFAINKYKGTTNQTKDFFMLPKNKKSISKIFLICIFFFTCFSFANEESCVTRQYKKDTAECNIDYDEFYDIMDTITDDTFVNIDTTYINFVDVAAFVCANKRLPSIYIDKRTCESLYRFKCGNSSVWKQQHLRIGGDIFKNHRGNLTDSTPLPDIGAVLKYHEADVGSVTSKNRGKERIVYYFRGDNCHVYYTKTHYCSFCRFQTIRRQ